jgi:hypothetical protein
MAPKRKSAYSAVLREAQQSSETVAPSNREMVEQQDSETVAPSNREMVEQQDSATPERLYSNTVTQSHSKTVKKERKISFYLTPEQERKLDDMAYDFLQRTGKRINRNDIVRFLVNQANVDLLIDRLDLHT